MIKKTLKHRNRHILLHKHLDELYADYIVSSKDISETIDLKIMDLIEWSYKQTKNAK